MRYNIYEEQLQSAELFGKPVLYTEKQVPREAVPEGWHCYDLCRGERQPNRPTELVDRSPWLRIGTVLSPVPLKRATTVASPMKGHHTYYSTYHIPAADRRRFQQVFGRNADFKAEDVVRITYGRNTIYEVQSAQEETMAESAGPVDTGGAGYADGACIRASE